MITDKNRFLTNDVKVFKFSCNFACVHTVFLCVHIVFLFNSLNLSSGAFCLLGKCKKKKKLLFKVCFLFLNYSIEIQTCFLQCKQAS